MIYIFKNNQQSGPYEEHVVLSQLRNGTLSASDLAVRHGESSWQPLSVLFPDVADPLPPPPPPPRLAAVPSDAGIPARSVEKAEPVYRKTALQKVFFGLAFLGIAAALLGAGYYFWSMMSPTGNLEADLRNISLRILSRNATVGLFLAAILSFIAFLLTFKRKLIATNPVRIILRLVFIFILVIGLISFAYGAFTYLNYSKPYSSSTTVQNEMIKALEEGEAITGPYEAAVIALPIAAGLILLGLSGFLMTKRPKLAT